MKSVKAVPPNGILFVFDPTNSEVSVPEYVDGELTASTNSCVSVGTQAPVDGETLVALERSEQEFDALHNVFSGRIDVPGGIVAVVTAEFQVLLEEAVPVGCADIQLWVDDARYPGKVVVNIV